MKKCFYSLITLMTAVFCANAEDIPAKIYVMGAGQSTINGTAGTWDMANAIPVNVIDGTAILNIENATGDYQIFTCSLEDAVNGGWAGDAPAQTSRIAAPSTDAQTFGTQQDVVSGKYISFGENKGNVSIVFSDNLTKVTILPTTLFCFGDAATKVNGSAIDWAGTVSVDVKDGYFTLPAEWAGPLTISPWVAGSTYGVAVAGEDFTTSPRRMMPVALLNKELTSVLNGNDLTPPYIADYIIKISQDLKTTEYTVNPRLVKIEIREGYWDANPVVYEMLTTDGTTYTYKFTEAIPAGRIFSILNKNSFTDTVWRRNGAITFGKEEGWYTLAGETESSATEAFTGTVTAVLPPMENLASDWANKYWSETPNASVLFNNDINTGVDDITVDNDIQPEYFNLQGIRVTSPDKGIYIERRGSAVRKIFRN